MMPSQPVSTALGAGSPVGTLHTASRAEIAAHQLDRLRGGLRRVLAGNRFYQHKLAGYDFGAVESLDSMRRLAFTPPAGVVGPPQGDPPHRPQRRFPVS